MKRILALTLACLVPLGLTQTVSAGPESLPHDGKETMKNVVEQPVVEENCNWTGFYIGVHVGYGWGDYKWADTDTSTFSFEGSDPPDLSGPSILVEGSADGVIAGGQLGYNYQFGRHFVVGVEGEFSYSDVSDTSSVTTDSYVNTFQTNSDWVGTIGLRAGFAWSRFLFYAKGGGAFAHHDFSLTHAITNEGVNNHTERFHADGTHIGPMVGGGLEYCITRHWSAKVEYMRMFLEKNDIGGTNVENDITPAPPEPEQYEMDLKRVDTVRFGLNYKF